MSSFQDSDIEHEELVSCPRCDREYDEIDHDFQSCSKCGYDVEKKCVVPDSIRQPTDADIDSGDYDLLNDRWI